MNTKKPTFLSIAIGASRAITAKMSAHVMRIGTIIPMMVGVIIMMSGCGSRQTSDSGVLMTSVAPLAYMVDKIAGEEWEVEPLVEPGYSPEDYSPTAERMAVLSSAKAVFIAGNLPVETTWISRVVGEAKALKSVDTSLGLQKDAFDPHTWLSPRNARVIYRNICNALCQIDSANTDKYIKRYNEAVQQADSIDIAIRNILKGAPSRTFVIVHPALTDFAKEYNLTQLAIEKDGKEPTPRTIKTLVEEAKKDGAKVVLLQKEFPAAAAEVIARQINGHVVVINPLSADWPAQMIHIAKAIANE